MTDADEKPTVGDVLATLSATTTEPGPEISKPASDRSGPPDGFGGGVNSYLNHYVGVADAKAAGFLGAALTVGAAVISLRPVSWLGHALYWLSVALLAASSGAASVAIFPRLPRAANRGLIFWEEIRVWPNAAKYQRALSELRQQDVEFEYAAQNFVVSEVLHRKHVWVRWTVGLFAAGTAAGLISYLVGRHA